MAPKFNLEKRIVQSISSLFKDENFADFDVVVNDTIYKCHRFILGSCSRFFYALFTTNMKEKIDNTARLHDIDSAIFEVILKICYTGENIVNEENVLPVWQAANRLQIPFLIELCELFSVSILSTNNYAKIYRMAKVFDSKSVLEGVTNFILKNFMTLKDDNFLLELSAKELEGLIENDSLVVDSEDNVLLSILKWVEFTSYTTSGVENQKESYNYNSVLIPKCENNFIVDKVFEIHPEKEIKDTSEKIDILEMQKAPQNRSAQLQCLLKASRLCLASLQCLQMLYHHRLIQSNEDAKTTIFDAIIYQMKGYHHGYFPPQAFYRNSSEFEHVGVIAHDTGNFEALSLARNKMYPMPTCKYIKNKIKLALFDNSIYAVGQADDSTSKVVVLKESSWTTIAELSGIHYILLSHKSYLYLFNADNEKVFRMNPNSIDKTPTKLDHKMGFVDLEFALGYKEYIIVFSTDEDASKEETSVYVMNTLNETWYRHENVDGPAKNMISFQDGDRAFILQRNGNLWSLCTDSALMITFKFITKIWEVKEHLRGALLFKDTLFLFLNQLFENPREKVLIVPGVYESFNRWKGDGYVSNCICTVMHNLDSVKK